MSLQPRRPFHLFTRASLLLLVAACADHGRIVAPPPSTLLELTAAPAPSVEIVCTRSWVNTAGGSWNTSTNWSPLGVPTSTDDVCIKASGTYTVTLPAPGASVRTVTIGGAGVIGVQTLDIVGQSTGTALTAASSIDNHGVIRLLWGGGTNGTASTIAVTDGLLTNHGTIATIADGIGAPRRIQADFLNLGSIDIGQATSLTKVNGRYENRGTINIPTGRTLSMVGVNRFVQHSGVLSVAGSFSLNGATFEFAGGEIVNDVSLVNSTLEIREGCESVGAFTMSGGNTLVGNVAAAQSIKIVGTGAGSVLTSAGSFENAGTIELVWGSGTNGTHATLAVTEGVLTNSGTIRTLTDAISSPRFIRASLVNTGTVEIGHQTWLEKAGAVYENRGTWNVLAGRSLNMVIADHRFVQSAGTLSIAGSMSVNNSAFDFTGGNITGAVALLNGTLTLGPDNAGTGDFLARGAVALVGNVGPKTIVRIQGTGTGSSLTSAGSFTNDGIIEQSWATGTNGTASTLAVTDGVLTNNGTIRTLTDAISSPRFINASFVNNGTISIGHQTWLRKANATYENRGTLEVLAGRSLVADVGSGMTFRQAAGELKVLGSMTVLGNTFEVAGGALTGNAPVLNGGTLRFTGTATGVLAVRGIVALEGDIPSAFTTKINTNPSTSTVVTSAGDFTNRGIIEMQSTGASNGIGVTLGVTAGKLTNEGTLRVLSDAFGGTPRTIAGSFLNSGTMEIVTLTTFAKSGGTYENAGTINNTRTVTVSGLSQTFINTGSITGGGTFNLGSMTMRASGNVQANLNLTSVAAHIGKAGPATLNVTGTYRMITGGSLDVELTNDPTPGTGHDRLNVTGGITLLGTLNVTPLDAQCIDPNLSFEIMSFGSRSGDFLVKNGLTLGGGRTLTAVPGATNYKLNSAGPPCVAPDVTAPIITPNVNGTMGLAGWYISDVAVSWTVTDAESAVTSTTGCDNSIVTTDTHGVTLTCSATSAGGTRTQSVTLKRDATPPVIDKTFSSEPNEHGWYNTAVSVAIRIADEMSGPNTGALVGVLGFNQEGANQSQTLGTLRDNAGNTAVATVDGINIDLTPPIATATRSPEANANGWNNTAVMANFSATDALSGIDGSATASQLFNAEVANQSASRVFTDKAGNSATVSVTGVSIDRTAPQLNYSRSPMANAAGWNNTDVTATYSASDPLSGIDGAASVTQLFSLEGAGQGGSHTFTDRAGNSATMHSDAINIDKTAPVVTVTRSPAPDATGWNDTDVTATWTASDALSGIDGSSSATHLFNQDGAGQSATRSFSDRAGNSASATISNINIDKTPAPPPPPPVLTPVCSVTPNEIWPANNKPVRVSVSVGGSGVTSFKLRSVTNNETGTADVDGWSLGTADLDGSVLAKRNGGGTGRTYTLTYDVFGANGATGSCAVTVRIPHDQRR